MTQPVFKDASMRARALLRSANSFLGEHIQFTLFFSFLIFVNDFLSYVISVRFRPLTDAFLKEWGGFDSTRSYQSENFFSSIIPEDRMQSLAQSDYAPYGIFGARLLTTFFFFSALFYLLSLLRKRDTSIVQEMGHAFRAIIKAPWMLILFVIDIVGSYSIAGSIAGKYFSIQAILYLVFLLYSILIRLPLCYAQPLLYDNYHSLSSVWEKSWDYVKKSWFIIFKYILLFVALYMLFILPLSLIVSAKIPAVIVALGKLLIGAYLGVLVLICYSMVYNHLRSRE